MRKKNIIIVITMIGLMFLLIFVVNILEDNGLNNELLTVEEQGPNETQVEEEEGVYLDDIFDESEYTLGDIRYVTPIVPLYEVENPYSTKEDVENYNSKIEEENIKLIIKSKTEIELKGNSFDHEMTLESCINKTFITTTSSFMRYPEEVSIPFYKESPKRLMCNSDYSSSDEKLINNRLFQIVEVDGELYLLLEDSEHKRTFLMTIE